MKEATKDACAVQVDLNELLEGRAAFYEMLAAFYFKPLTQEQVDTIARLDLSVYEGTNDVFDKGIRQITEYLRTKNTGTRQELAVDFTSAFAGTKAYEGRSAVPYKSVFTSEEGLIYQEGHKEVFAAFKAEAVKKREGLDYPDDHISFMCEFMALLSRRTAQALEQHDTEQAIHAMEASLSFLTDHMMSWFDECIALAEKILKTKFYRGILALTKGYFELDHETLEDLLVELQKDC